jgi:uncharacterized membrane protein
VTKVEREVMVAVPARAAYEAWRNFENLPRIMHHIEEVRVVGNGRSHWKARGPLGMDAEWDAEMTMDEPNRTIAWRSIEGNSSVKTAGRVDFEESGDETCVRVMLTYDAPAGVVGDTAAKILSNPERQIEEDLQRFKETIESGWELAAPSGDAGKSLGGSLGATTEADLGTLDATNDPGLAPQDVDDPARRSG